MANLNSVGVAVRMSEIKGEVSQAVFEFLHMEILLHFMAKHGEDAKARGSRPLKVFR